MTDLLCRNMSESYWDHVRLIFDFRATRADKYFSLESYEVVLWSYVRPIFDYNFNKLSWVNV